MAALGLIALCVSAPLLFLPGLSNPFALPKEAAIVIFASLGALAWALSGFWRAAAFRPGVADAALLLYLAWSAVGGLLATDPFLWRTRVVFDLSLAAAYYATRRASLQAWAYREVLRAISIAAVLVAALGVLELAGAWSALPGSRSMLSTLGYPNFVSQLLLMALPLVLLEWAWAQGARGAAPWMLAAALVLFVDFRSHARGAWLATLGSLLILVRLWDRAGFRGISRRSAAGCGLLVVAMGAALLASLPPNLIPRPALPLDRRAGLYDVESKEISILNRWEIWRASLRMARASPLGVGAGNFESVYPRYRSDAEVLYGDLHQRYAHNGFLQILVERGWIGLLLFLAFLGAHARGLAGALASGDPKRRLRIAAVGASLAGMTLHGLVDLNFETPVPLLLLFVLLGLARADSDTAPAPLRPHTPRLDPVRRWIDGPRALPRLQAGARICARALLVCLAGGAFLAVFDSFQRLRADAAHGRATRLLSGGQAEPAAGLFERACALVPGNIRYRHDCSRMSLLRGELARAIDHAEFVVRRAPFLPEPRLVLANALNERGNRLGVRGDWTTAVASYAGAIETLEGMGRLPLGESRSAGLVRALANAFYNRGNAHLWLGRAERAAEDYAAAVRVEPFHARALAGLGDTLLRQGRGQEALEAYSKAVRLQPQDPQILKRAASARRGASAPPFTPSASR